MSYTLMAWAVAYFTVRFYQSPSSKLSYLSHAFFIILHAFFGAESFKMWDYESKKLE